MDLSESALKGWHMNCLQNFYTYQEQQKLTK